MFKRGGNWSSDTKCGGKRSGGFVDVNGGVSKGGALVVTYNEYPSGGSNGGRGGGCKSLTQICYLFYTLQNFSRTVKFQTTSWSII